MRLNNRTLCERCYLRGELIYHYYHAQYANFIARRLRPVASDIVPSKSGKGVEDKYFESKREIEKLFNERINITVSENLHRVMES